MKTANQPTPKKGGYTGTRPQQIRKHNKGNCLGFYLHGNFVIVFSTLKEDIVSLLHFAEHPKVVGKMIFLSWWDMLFLWRVITDPIAVEPKQEHSSSLLRSCLGDCTTPGRVLFHDGFPVKI